MSAPTNCTSCCDPATVVNVPGVQGESGTNGSPGTDGVSAFSITTSDFTVPAIGDSVTVLVADSSWMTVGQNVFVEGAGYFSVASKASALSASLTYLDYAGNTNTGNNISTGAQISPAGTQPALAAALPTAFTDNSTGTPSDTIAAGVGVQKISFPHTFIGGTAAVEPVTNYTVGFNFKILSWAFVTEVLLVGAAGSRVANMEINTTDVGTVPSTVTIPIANAAVGVVTAGTAVSGANTGNATDTISIEIQSGGTQFTAGSGTFIITLQNMDDANSAASLAAHIGDLITALT